MTIYTRLIRFASDNDFIYINCGCLLNLDYLLDFFVMFTLIYRVSQLDRSLCHVKLDAADIKYGNTI